MHKVLNGMQMKQADTYTISEIGIPAAVLMERAALAVRDAAAEQTERSSRILVVCGSGNNGGDGYAVARLLLPDHPAVEVFFAGNPDSCTELCSLQRYIYRNLGGREIRGAFPEDPECYDLIIDALFGIGLSRDITGRYAEIITAVNRSRCPVISVDIPSGINASTGRICAAAVRADITVTFQFLKKGLLLYPGAEYAGAVRTADVGIILPEKMQEPGQEQTAGAAMSRQKEAEQIALQQEEAAVCFEKSDIQKLLPARCRRSNKGMYGKVSLLAGNRQIAGCALLAAKAAAHTGSGLVQCISHKKNRDIIVGGAPELLFAEKIDYDWPDVIAAGPGIGTGSDEVTALQELLVSYRGKLVLDADALTIIGAHEELSPLIGKQTVLTPHPGEMSRLIHVPIRDIMQQPMKYARELAQKWNCIVLLKDAATVVTDGKREYINVSGCDGMACGGSGDVLTGIIASLMGQGMESYEAACLGAYIHGLAGEAAQSRYGARAMQAGDIIESLGEVTSMTSRLDEQENG